MSVSNNGVDESARFKTVVYDTLCHACDKEGKCSPNVDEVRIQKKGTSYDSNVVR